MGYSFWELYSFKRLPTIRWRGSPKEDFYKEKFPDNFSRKHIITRRCAKAGLAFSIIFFPFVAYYNVLKREGLLHYLHSPWLGVDLFWDKAVMTGIRKHFEEERACRQREAYKKAIELREQKIMEQFKSYEETDDT